MKTRNAVIAAIALLFSAVAFADDQPKESDFPMKFIVLNAGSSNGFCSMLLHGPDFEYVVSVRPFLHRCYYALPKQKIFGRLHGGNELEVLVIYKEQPKIVRYHILERRSYSH